MATNPTTHKLRATVKKRKRNAILEDFNHFQTANKQAELAGCPPAASRRPGLWKSLAPAQPQLSQKLAYVASILIVIGVERCRMSVSWPFVYASVVMAGLLGSGGIAGTEELGAEQARAFIVGRLFAFTCFEGTTGMGRILSDGSVVGAVRIHGQGEPQFHRLPAGTVRIDGRFLCANVAGLPFTPCARVEKIDYRRFRSSLVGLSFAYCEFHQRNPRTHIVAGERDW